jgi:hypothetical protein
VGGAVAATPGEYLAVRAGLRDFVLVLVFATSSWLG